MTEPGLVVVDKPAGITSHDVVARVRRLAGTRKVGHAGTLDPMATGVLVVGVERATRLLGHLMLTDKAYDATVRLGVATTTDDAEGEVTSTASTGRPRRGSTCARRWRTSPATCSRSRPRSRRSRWTASAPTSASATASRSSSSRGRSPSTSSSCTTYAANGDVIDVDVSLRCSSGTYVRAIARDAGTRLGVGGHLAALRRTAVGPYGLDVARTLDQLADSFEVLPIAAAARAAFPSVDLDDDAARDVRVGRPLDLALERLTAVFAPDGEFLALYEPRDGRARPVAVFV